MAGRSTRTIESIEKDLADARGARLKSLVAELADDPRSGVAAACERAINRERARTRESRRISGLYRLQQQLEEDGCTVVVGVDEVGRGALAGPLTAGACVLPASPRISGLNDSKLLSPTRRTELAEQIKRIAVCWAVGHVEPAEIDSAGMSTALRTAMKRAVGGLGVAPDHVIIDGLPLGLFTTETAVVKGDSKVASVAAASILAKVERDALMVGWSSTFPEYSLEINKGYGTPEHLAAISAHGLSAIHRVSFSYGGGTATLF